MKESDGGDECRRLTEIEGEVTWWKNGILDELYNFYESHSWRGPTMSRETYTLCFT